MWLACPECRDDGAFEQPPCEEGHGLDCPEWFCVTCGFAVFAGGWEFDEHDINGHDIDGRSVDGHAIAKASKPAQRHHAA